MFLIATLHVDLRIIFYLAIVQGLLAVCMIALVTEQTVAVAARTTLDLNLRRFPAQY